MSTASSWLSIVSIVLFLGLMSCFWIGLAGMWRTRRGAPWWLMAIGTALNTVGPIAYSLSMFMLFDSMGSRGASAPSFATSVSVMLGISGVLIPCGIILFAIGFAIHGQRAARVQERAKELEELVSAMSAEMDRMKAGGTGA